MDENWVMAPDPNAVPELEVVNAILSELSDDELAEALREWTTRQRFADAMCAAVTVAVFERVSDQGYPISGAMQTVAAITVTSTRSASRTISVDTAITSESAVWTALATGRIDRSRARIISEVFAEVPDADRPALVAKALAFAESHTAYQTRRKAVRLLIDYDPGLGPEHVERERAKAWDSRHLRVHPCPHGMAEIVGYVPSGTARILLAALDKVARTYDDDRTLDQKRVDALAQILADNTHLSISVEVVIPADTLAGLQDRGASVDGYGPIDGEDARSMALRDDARWQALITDPASGRLIGMSSRNYSIPPRMKAAVRARDRVCRFPGCTTQARNTDTDHVVPWPKGPTEPTNLAPECRGHHRVKTHSGWCCHTRDDGALVWTSPLGSEHVSYPWNYNDPDY